jgi:MoxR-like ATPase
MNATHHAIGTRIIQTIQQVVLGQNSAIELAVCCFLSSGHLLIEDVPGVGKTTLARALAAAVGGSFRRIQFTSDLLPADIIGVTVWDSERSEFEFKRGPVFGNIILADEINRATPKTQSALLEAMSEKSISQDGSAHPLPKPFMVVATQNEQERHGTYPLPESQLDRFLMRISMGYPEMSAERMVVSRKSLADPVSTISPVVDPADYEPLIGSVDEIHMDASLLDYLMEIINRTRSSEMVALGVGPRGGMALHRASRAMALLKGRDFVLADDIKLLAIPVLAHRIIPTSDAYGRIGSWEITSRIIKQILDSVEIPT